ncbi:zinc ribbon domain-containing protein [Sulfurovum sp. CS9]|uniref:zinc ribbon domain-containing protein n=1 Tax=Sulfurovum sp. CS9 TaxID=3391146 RepID=UPI0039ECBD1E
MSIINCPECGKEVSNKALVCTHCGYELKKPTRGFFGQIFKWLFILFNIFMAFSIYKGMSDVSEVVATDTTGGAIVGAGIGFSMLLGLWAMGDIILGAFVLFTKPKA